MTRNVDARDDLAPSSVEAVPSDPLTEPASTPQARLAIVDKLRGFVIALMVLDHVRDFFHIDAGRFSPTDLSRTTALLFATRWVTHLCAPTFVFLAGVAIYLQWARGKRGCALSRFLLSRGLWLILIEVTLVTLAFTFAWHGALLQVIWAIGCAMVLMSALVWLPPPAILALGLIVVVGHDALAGIEGPGAPGSVAASMGTLMLRPGSIHLPFAGFDAAYVAYPAIPWFGIMAVGFGAGRLFERPAAARDRRLVAAGLAMLGAFAVLRGFNLYGDPSPWTGQPDATRSALAFLKVSKYPPSLDYTLVTLGLTLSLAPLVERIGGPLGQAMRVFGRTPLFTYLAHLYVARGLAILLALAQGLSPTIFTDGFAGGRDPAASGWGLDLPGVYAAWLLVLLILWPLATWYAGVKARQRSRWLSYL